MSTNENNENDKNESKDKKVEVTVDGKEHKVRPSAYLVSEFKTLVKVDAAKELEQLIAGKFVPLADDASVTIGGGETFMSHVRRGGSSWQ